MGNSKMCLFLIFTALSYLKTLTIRRQRWPINRWHSSGDAPAIGQWSIVFNMTILKKPGLLFAKKWWNEEHSIKWEVLCVHCTLTCTRCCFKWGVEQLWALLSVSATAVTALPLSRDPTKRPSAHTRACVMDWLRESYHLVVHALAERGGPHVSNDICLESSKVGFKYFRFKVTFVSIVHTVNVVSQIHLRLPKQCFHPREHAVQLCDCQSWCFTNYSCNFLPIVFLITYKSLSRHNISIFINAFFFQGFF